MRHVLGVFLILASGIAHAGKMACVDQKGKSFGFLECEPTQAGLCYVNAANSIESWCQTPSSSQSNNLQELLGWVRDKTKSTGKQLSDPVQVTAGTFQLAPGLTLSVPGSLQVYRQLERKAASNRSQFTPSGDRLVYDPPATAFTKSWKDGKPTDCEINCGNRDNCYYAKSDPPAPGQDDVAKASCWTNCKSKCIEQKK
ncbi:MAG: hypothetical protein Q8Q73_07255 [Stagnimonas sp.]|nr:hypothetical protein [Stagnimonas sp.]